MNWLSPKTVAKKLDMSSKSVLRMLDRGELPAVTFPSGRKRVSEEALERFLRNLEKKGKRQPSTRGDFATGNGDSLTRSSAVQSSDHAAKSA